MGKMDFGVLFEESLAEARQEIVDLPFHEWRKIGLTKSKADLLGSHTVVTYPPLDALHPVDGRSVFEEIKLDTQIDLYVHFPFCEYPCKFCPYTTLSLRDPLMGDYFDALLVEMGYWANKLKEQGSIVRSIYFGGGTPLAVPLEYLERVLHFIWDHFSLVKRLELCVESSPPAILRPDAEERLKLLKRFGLNRINIGIQTFDFETLRDSARTFAGHKHVDEENAVKRLLQSGIQNVNVDMIQDLPVQSTDYLQRLRNDLVMLGELKPAHITWYNLRLRPETMYAHQMIQVPSLEESLLSRLVIWNFLEKIGYTILEGDRFALHALFEDNFRKTRGSVETTLLGMGVSAYSHTSKMFFQNTRLIGENIRTTSRRATEEYIQRVRTHGNAITHGMILSPKEWVAGKLALGLKKGIDWNELRKKGTMDSAAREYLIRAEKKIDTFTKAGLLILENGKLGFTRQGRLFENEICREFYTEEVVQQAQERRVAEMSSALEKQ